MPISKQQLERFNRSWAGRVLGLCIGAAWLFGLPYLIRLNLDENSTSHFVAGIIWVMGNICVVSYPIYAAIKERRKAKNNNSDNDYQS